MPNKPTIACSGCNLPQLRSLITSHTCEDAKCLLVDYLITTLIFTCGFLLKMVSIHVTCAKVFVYSFRWMWSSYNRGSLTQCQFGSFWTMPFELNTPKTNTRPISNTRKIFALDRCILVMKMYTIWTSHTCVEFKSPTNKQLNPRNFCIRCPNDAFFNVLDSSWSMFEENWQLATNELLEFEKEPVEARDCRKITDQSRGIHGIYPNFIKENQRMSTCNRLGL